MKRAFIFLGLHGLRVEAAATLTRVPGARRLTARAWLEPVGTLELAFQPDGAWTVAWIDPETSRPAHGTPPGPGLGEEGRESFQETFDPLLEHRTCSFQVTFDPPLEHGMSTLQAVDRVRWSALFADLEAFLAVVVDPLTGLCQRNLFLDLLTSRQALFTGHILALIDIDHFGRLTDVVSTARAQILVVALRDVIEPAFATGELELLARYGSDKLALLARTNVDACRRAFEQAASGFRAATSALDIPATFQWATEVIEAGTPVDVLLDRVERRLRATKKSAGRAKEPPG